MTDRPNASTINDAQLDGLYAERDRLNADLAALRAVARGYCPACGRGDAAPTTADWEQQRQRADNIQRMYLTAMGDLGIAANRLDHIRNLVAGAAHTTAAGISDYDIGRHDMARAVLTALDTAPGPAATQATDDTACTCGGRFPTHHLHADTHQPTESTAPGDTPDGRSSRWVHVTIHNRDPYTANRQALSLVDWIHAEFPGLDVTTDAREWDDHTAPGEAAKEDSA